MTQNEFQQKVITELSAVKGSVQKLDGFQQKMVTELSAVKGSVQKLETFAEEQKQVNAEQKEFNKQHLESNKDMKVTHESLKFLIEHEVVERLTGIEEKVKVYADYAIRKHEREFHHVPATR